MNITITHTISHTISPEAISLLEKLLAGKSGGAVSSAPVEDSKVKKLPVKKQRGEADAAVTPPATDAAPGTAGASTPNVEPVTLESVRAAVQVKAQAGKKDAIKALLQEFGVSKVTDLDSAKYSDFLTKANAL